MSKTYEEIVKELDSNIPRDVISKRDGGFGKKLDYLEGWYVKDRLNQVLGHGSWSFSITEQTVVHNSVEQDAQYVAILTTGRLTVHGFGESGKFAEYTDVGFGNSKSKQKHGEAYELAAKEAATDALKRCAINLGRSMGLALYDKSQEHVGAATTAPKSTSVKTSGKSATGKAKLGQKHAQRATDDYRALVKQQSIILNTTGVATLADQKAAMKTRYGVDSADALKPEQLKDFANFQKELLPNQKEANA